MTLQRPGIDAPKKKPRGRPFSKGHDERRKPGGQPRSVLRGRKSFRALIREEREGNVKALVELRDSPETPPELRFEIMKFIAVMDDGMPGQQQKPTEDEDGEGGGSDAADDALLALPPVPPADPSRGPPRLVEGEVTKSEEVSSG